MPYEPLGDDAVTAFRLVMDEDGTAAIAHLMATWNLLSFAKGQKATVDRLPPEIRRVGDRAVHDGPVEPIVLTQDEVLLEAFRYAAIRKAPDHEGWQLHSEVVRAGNALASHTVFTGDDGIERRFNNHTQNSRHVEVRRNHNDTMYVRLIPEGSARIVDGVIPMVTLTVRCPGDAETRRIAEFRTFGQGRQHVLRQDTTMIADGTCIRLSLEGESDRTACFDARTRTWRTPEGGSFRRIDPEDQTIHHYPNGRYVDGLIGYVTHDRKGRYHACVGQPFDSQGDDDASVVLFGRREAANREEALTFLEERGDLDRIFTKTITINSMGVWLRTLSDEDGAKA